MQPSFSSTSRTIVGEEAAPPGANDVGSLNRAAAFYERSVALDSGFALGWAKLAQVDPEPFQLAVRVARGESAIPPAQALATVGGYVNGMERLVSHLDHFSAGARPKPAA